MSQHTEKLPALNMISQMRWANPDACPEIKFISEDMIELRWVKDGKLICNVPMFNIDLSSYKSFLTVCREAKRAMKANKLIK